MWEDSLGVETDFLTLTWVTCPPLRRQHFHGRVKSLHFHDKALSGKRCSGLLSKQPGFIFKEISNELKQQIPRFPVSHHLGDSLRNAPLFWKTKWSRAELNERVIFCCMWQQKERLGNSGRDGRGVHDWDKRQIDGEPGASLLLHTGIPEIPPTETVKHTAVALSRKDIWRTESEREGGWLYLCGREHLNWTGERESQSSPCTDS